MTFTQVIKNALTDNLERIPFTIEGGYVATNIGEIDDDEHHHISVTGYMDENGQMMQEVTVIYFDTLDKAKRFRISPGALMTHMVVVRTTLTTQHWLETPFFLN